MLKNIKVDYVIIGAQAKCEENYIKFVDIIREKNIKTITVNKGDRMQIEDNIYFDILWPNKSKLMTDNALNNNSLVCNLHYKEFSMLFTGDIENVAEKQILAEYQNNSHVLSTTILKVAHHGSKTSSGIDFIKMSKPKIALIGVGKDNKFGHPSVETINNLRDNGAKIYRTDYMGEITVTISSNGRVKVEKYL